MQFNIQSKHKPTGDQPKAIKQLTENLKQNKAEQILLGVTGSGKTFTMANVIQKTQRPTLIICHNKTLTAQLANELQELFPENAVCYFVSYYDYYLPESYIPSSDTYLEKETSINDEIDRLRHYATEALFTRDDVIIVASVSCIYGLGSPEQYAEQTLELKLGQKINRQDLIKQLLNIYYQRNDYESLMGTFSLRGDSLEIRKSSSTEKVVIDLWGDKIEKIVNTGQFNEQEQELDFIKIFPAKHYVTEKNLIKKVIPEIKQELKDQVKKLKSNNKLVEAQRLNQRVTYDLEMLAETGFVNGIENYSRYLSQREPGKPPAVLLDFFKIKHPDFLTIIDESHITLPQIRGMFAGDRARKQTLVEYGFRLPSCLDNRPLTFAEFNNIRGQVIYSSATPGVYEFGKITKNLVDLNKLKKTNKPEQNLKLKQDLKAKALKSNLTVQQLIRPTGLLDPEIKVKPIKNQIQDLIQEVEKKIAKKQRVLVTTLTKKNSEALSKFLQEKHIKAYYLHSSVENMERLEILRDLRLGVYDVVVGINLLREGLDLPEVSLVAILDADKQGFLRNETSLIQTIGRAARHVHGRVLMYADKITPAMKEAIFETKRRRKIQKEFNEKHGIIPKGIKKEIRQTRLAGMKKQEPKKEQMIDKALKSYGLKPAMDGNDKETIDLLQQKMELAAKNLDFEKAAEVRDLIKEVKERR